MDFYRILGVNRNASQQEVKDAWRREALKNHPDRLQNASDFEKAEAARRFKEAKEAYEVLSDEGKRGLYNTSGRSAVYAAAQRQGRTSPYGSDFTPRARSSWSNSKYQQQRYNRHASAFSFFRGFTSSMGRTDAYFHAGFAGILLVGVVVFAPLADSLWDRRNSGKLFKHMKPANAENELRTVRGQTQYQDESERLRAQGVPADVITGMRTFNAHGFAKPSHGPSDGSIESAPEKVSFASSAVGSDGKLFESPGQQHPVAGLAAQAMVGRPGLGKSEDVEILGQSKASNSVEDRQGPSPSALECCSAAVDETEEQPKISCEPANSAGLVATENLLPDRRLLEHAAPQEAEGNAGLSPNESDQVQ